jgi:nucleotide-binding universal stress UspA family protein
MYGRRIVVGVDGSVSSALAVSWAADECRLRDTLLLIAHCPDIYDARAAVQFGEAGLRSIDRRAEHVLATFSHAASCRQPTVPVTSLISHSDAPNALIDLSVGSEMLVLGSHGHGLPEHSAGRLVVAQAHCPVLVVPNTTRLDPLSMVPSVVHVVVDQVANEGTASFADHEARMRDVPLRTVHWGAPGLRDHDGALFVVGRCPTDDRWSARLDPVPTTLLTRMNGPVVVVSESAVHRPDAGPLALSVHRPEE